MVETIEISLYADTNWADVIDAAINEFESENNAALISSFPVVRHGFVESVIATFRMPE